MIKCRMYLEKHRVRVRALAKAISNWSKSRLNNCVPVSLSVGAGRWLRSPGQGFSWLSNPSTLVTRLGWGQGIPPKGLVMGEENLIQLLLSVDGKNMPKHRFFCLMLGKRLKISAFHLALLSHCFTEDSEYLHCNAAAAAAQGFPNSLPRISWLSTSPSFRGRRKGSAQYHCIPALERDYHQSCCCQLAVGAAPGLENFMP